MPGLKGNLLADALLASEGLEPEGAASTPATAGASAPAPSPAAPATPTPAPAAAPDPNPAGPEEWVVFVPSDGYTDQELTDHYQRLIREGHTPLMLFQVIGVDLHRYWELVPDSHPRIADLLSTARDLIELYMTGTRPSVTHPNDESLVILLGKLHPTADEATIKSALWAAYQEVCG